MPGERGARDASAAAEGMHDLHHIAFGQHMLGMTAAADDLAVYLNRHPALQQLLGREQVQEGR